MPIVTVELCGFFQPLELASYDLQFSLNPYEPMDQNIVIVEYDEPSIQLLKEATISDVNLVTLLNNIIEQKPHIIGLDIYREFSVAAQTTKKDNDKAYESLKEIFASYPRIVGVKSILHPSKPGSSNILEEREKIAASDLPVDQDFRIRRSYLFPTADEDGNATQIPYIGLVLASKYLEYDGWQTDNTDNPKDGVKISKQNKEVILRHLNSKLSKFKGDDLGWDYLVNWRKSKENKSFLKISVSDVLNNKLSPTLFQNRLVIIGNTTAYNGDIHQTPLTRWGQSNSFRNPGVEIVAHTASSIINTVKEGRNLINSTPIIIHYFLLIFPVLSLAYKAEVNVTRNDNFSLDHLRLTTIFFSLLFGSLIVVVNFVAFRLGWWINVIPSLIGIFSCLIFINIYYQLKREKDDFNNLIFIIQDLNHNLGNICRNLIASKDGMKEIAETIYDETENDLMINDTDYVVDISETSIGLNLTESLKYIEDIEYETNRIIFYKKRTSDFLKYTYFNKKRNRINTGNFNTIIEQIVKRSKLSLQHNYDYQIDIIEDYDNSISDCKLYAEALEILIESLLDNAFYAVNPIFNYNKNQTPQVSIKTINTSKFIKIIVQDNGSGIPKKFHKKVFLAQISFKDGYGKGTGLYLVSRIIQYWKGSIILESEVQKGTTFSISLPKVT